MSVLYKLTELRFLRKASAGTEDPIIPYAHGVNLASVIPNSRLLTLEGTGHELHRNDWGVIINEIVDFTSTR